jgi:5-formyltetrahydrofolate cyclo-ligase
MNMGLDFSEILVILLLILLFFGSKELPYFFKKAAKFIGQIRMYTEKVKREFNEIAKIDEPMPSYEQETVDKKNAIRQKHMEARKNIPEEFRVQKSAAIAEILKKDAAFVAAKSVMLYMATGMEVQTKHLIQDALALGKRVVLPYSKDDMTLGIGEIKDVEADLVLGTLGVHEPKKELWDNFFRSDIQLVICPGVAFDIHGARLGRGKGYYDRFAKEIKGRVPLYGLAFDCQLISENDRIPFAYHDVVMDQVITESGYLLKNPETVPLSQAPDAAKG